MNPDRMARARLRAERLQRRTIMLLGECHELDAALRRALPVLGERTAAGQHEATGLLVGFDQDLVEKLRATIARLLDLRAELEQPDFPERLDRDLRRRKSK